MKGRKNSRCEAAKNVLTSANEEGETAEPRGAAVGPALPREPAAGPGRAGLRGGPRCERLGLVCRWQRLLPPGRSLGAPGGNRQLPRALWAGNAPAPPGDPSPDEPGGPFHPRLRVEREETQAPGLQGIIKGIARLGTPAALRAPGRAGQGAAGRQPPPAFCSPEAGRAGVRSAWRHPALRPLLSPAPGRGAWQGQALVSAVSQLRDAPPGVPDTPPPPNNAPRRHGPDCFDAPSRCRGDRSPRST